jgi:predicted RNA binding protein YcfA (HicA-like mRNA interferase family)
MPSATAREFQRVARMLSFILVGQKGATPDGTIPDGRAATIPLHGGAEIWPPIFNRILCQLGITLDEFQKLRQK